MAFLTTQAVACRGGRGAAVTTALGAALPRRT